MPRTRPVPLTFRAVESARDRWLDPPDDLPGDFDEDEVDRERAGLSAAVWPRPYRGGARTADDYTTADLDAMADRAADAWGRGR